MYSVTIEPAHRLLRIRVDGFWSMEVMTAYVAELRQQSDALRNAGGCERILVDMSDYPIQSRAVADGHAQIIARAKAMTNTRTALVMKSALSRLQAMRVADLAGDQLFEDEASARAWLLAQPAEV